MIEQKSKSDGFTLVVNDMTSTVELWFVDGEYKAHRWLTFHEIARRRDMDVFRKAWIKESQRSLLVERIAVLADKARKAVFVEWANKLTEELTQDEHRKAIGYTVEPDEPTIVTTKGESAMPGEVRL